MPHDLAMTTLYHLRGGGWVMLPLAAVSLWMWYLILRKAWEFHSLRREEQAGGQGGDIPIPAWQRAVIDGFAAHRTGNDALDCKLIKALADKELARSERGIKTILLLAGIAPLLGLLGTVGGMITTFDSILEFGTGNARALSSGISAALITTQSGLVVAVPGLLAGTTLMRRASNLRARAQCFCIAAQDAIPAPEAQA